MTTPLGHALRMQLQLERLFTRDGFIPAGQTLEHFPDNINELVVLSGLASTIDIDHERCCFAPFAFGWLPLAERVPLLLHHEGDPVGLVKELRYDARGQLEATVTTEHPTARRCPAFSVGAKVLEFEITDSGPRQFFARITRAVITDLSLTRSPCNPFALVKIRRPLDDTEKLIERLGKLPSLFKTAIGATT